MRWLMELHRRLQLYPETLVLAVAIMDRFLAPIKVPPTAACSRWHGDTGACCLSKLELASPIMG